MEDGLFGISWPSLAVLRDLIIDQYRGLLWVAPIAILYPIGLVAMLCERRYLALGVLGATVVTYYLFVNSGYAYWDGGYSIGPRHLTPMLPFVMLAIALVWVRRGAVVRSLMVALGVVGATVNIMAMATTVTPSDAYREPITDLIGPRFLAGEVHSVIGSALGLEGLISLVPLCALAGLLLVPLISRNFVRDL